jgi:hypothetical protein
MSGPQWFYATDDERHGPFDTDTLIGHLLHRNNPQKTLVWHQGLKGWSEAETLAELRSALPPPLPVKPPSREDHATPMAGSVASPIAAAKPDVNSGDSIIDQESPSPQLKYHGVGGWLALFCVGLLVLTPAVTLISLSSGLELIRYSETLPGLKAYLLFDAIAGLGLTAFSITTGIALVRVKKNAVRLAGWYLAFYFGYALFETVMPYALGVSLEWTSEMSNELARIATYVIVWAAYLKKSKRVRATYGDLTSPESMTALQTASTRSVRRFLN